MTVTGEDNYVVDLVIVYVVQHAVPVGTVAVPSVLNTGEMNATS